MTKAFIKRILLEKVVITRKYRYTYYDYLGGPVIMRIPVELYPVSKMWDNWEAVMVINWEEFKF